ncbi:hypothetical protein [Azohydromonas australica]|uniref:hypothetical protein n=1 Tax=Azohydromonas australica TaxID=364039 RepID=UPI000424838C|nr:hypothetical protein [Azohydromonas australica]
MRNVVVPITLGACLMALLQACTGMGAASSPAGSSTTSGMLRGTGPGLSLHASTPEPGNGSTSVVTLTLRNNGAETATRLQELALPTRVRMVRDGCTGQPLPAASRCTYTVALEGDLPNGATMALAVGYDYADLPNRSAGGSLVYPKASSVVASLSR